MKRTRFMVFALVISGGLQTVSAQVSDPDQQNQTQEQTANRGMVSVLD